MDNRPTRANRRPEQMQRTPNRQNPARPAAQGTRYRAGQVQRQRPVQQNSGRRTQASRPETRPVQPQQRSVVRRVNDLERREKAVTEAKKDLALQKKTDRWLTRYNRDVEIQKREAVIEENWQNAVIRYKGGFDFWMCVFILILMICGTATVFSASYPLAVYESDNPLAYISRQMMYTGFGLVIALVAMFFEPKYYKKWLPFLLYGAGVIFLVAAQFIGTKEGETLRWIDLGPINIQPSEVMKVGIIFLLAWYADVFETKMNDITLSFGKQYLYNVVIPVGILGLAAILVLLGKHLSGFAIAAAIGGLMLIISTRRVLWLILTALPMAFLLGIGYLIKNPYALLRITAAVDKEQDTLGAMYQTLQSVNAIGAGGLLGAGFGESRQKYHFLTQSHTDFIFSVWCEETGFVGALCLIILFLLIIWRGYTIARRAENKFSMLLAFGITTHIGIQAFLHMMVCSRLFFNTGVTLPFFSYGGSSLVIFMAEMGVLLCISRHYCRKKTDVERERLMKQMGME